MQYKNTFGKIQVMKNEHLFRGKTLGVSMSGGADSTMLCYLLAKTIKKRDLQITIQPYNGYDIWAPLDSRGIIKIVQYIQSTFPTVDIQWPISTVFDTNGASASEGDKNSYIRPLIDKLVTHNVVDLVMSGVSLGPPVEVQESLSGHHPITRLPGYHLWDEVERASDNLAPFKYVDKRFIIQCYKDFNRKELLEMTNSCTAPQGNCGECWWCQERSWAIDTVFGDTINNIIETVEDSI